MALLVPTKLKFSPNHIHIQNLVPARLKTMVPYRMPMGSSSRTSASTILDLKKENSLKEDKLTELNTLHSSEENILQGIVQTLEQHLKLMEKT